MHRLKKTLEPKYLVSFIFHFSLFLLICFGTFGLLIIIFLNRKIGPTYREGISALHRIQAQLPFILFITVFVQAMTLCGIALLFVLFWSHSIAGPLVRFRKHLRDIVQGKFIKEPMTFRSADQLHGLALAFSELSAVQRDNCVKAQALLVEARRLLDECKTLSNQNKEDSEAFNLKLHELRKIYSRIKNIYSTSKSD